MKSALYIYSIVIFITILGCKKEESVPETCADIDYSNHPQHSFFSEELSKFHVKNNAPGSIIAIKSNNSPLWIGAKGQSNIDHNSLMRACTPFRIGSITKVYVAVLTLKLIEQNKLSLESTIIDFLPELSNKIPSADKITIRQMLNNTSGIIDPKNESTAYQLEIINNPEYIGTMSIDERLKKYVYGKPLHFEPGTRASYSNTGYWIIGKIIERIEQKPLQKVFEEQLFTPYGLNDTYLEKRNDQNVCRGYAFLSGKLTDVTSWDRADGDGDPSAGMISTAQELITFGEKLFHGEILTTKSMAEMTSIVQLPSCPNGNCEFGLGLEEYDSKNYKGFGKNGTSSGVDANWIYFPEKQTHIIIFVNRGDGNDKSVMDNILQ